MADHPSRDELAALVSGELAPDRLLEVIPHLLGPCAICLGRAPVTLAAFADLDDPLDLEDDAVEAADADGAPAASTMLAPETDAAYDAALDRALAAVLERHGRGLDERAASERRRRERDRAALERALECLSTGGFEALAAVPPHVDRLALTDALLDRSWALRHEDPELMIRLAELAIRVAETVEGEPGAASVQCRAWAELGNAYRVADQLDEADDAFGRATGLYARTGGDSRLGIRLLDRLASLAGDRRHFEIACGGLVLVHEFHRRHGDLHSAGRALLKLGIYTGYAGEPEGAVTLIERSRELLDPARDPALVVSAVHSELWFLVDCGRVREARKLLFLERPRLGDAPGGRLNQLKVRWLEGKIDAGLGKLDRAGTALAEVRLGLTGAGLGYQAAIASVDLAAVLLRQGRADEAQDLVAECVKVFAAVRVEREALGALLVLRRACELRAATAGLVEEVATFLRRAEHDPHARFEPGRG